ncbi:MAG: hydantoinase/oxoprolinase family protein [Burkholderiales bacterium]
MPSETVVGWDIGGAHLKAVALDSDAQLTRALQLPCTLWRGIEHLERAMAQALSEMKRDARHAVTMTGELADCFVSRREGVAQILRVVTSLVPCARIYAKDLGFLTVEQALRSPIQVASASWHASATFIGRQLNEALLLDIGSTTADLTLIREGRIQALGEDDHSRLANDELVYCGVIRTPLMAIAQRAPFCAKWVNVMAEHFATTADIYRLTGELAQGADQSETADGREKTVEANARRLARMIGCDFEDFGMESWLALAQFFANEQLNRLLAACAANLSRGVTGKPVAIVGAGVGNFLARKIAVKLDSPYRDFALFVPSAQAWNPQCAPAFAVAWLCKDSEL